MYAKKHQVRQAKHQTKNQIRQTKDQVCQNTPSMPNTPNQTPSIAVEIQKCEFVFQNFHLRFFVAKKFLFQIYALCWCTFYSLKSMVV